MNLPLGGWHVTQIIAMPKTPWKPRVTLTAEVGELLTWGMTEDYDHEPEHSAMAKELATKADKSPPPKMEVPVLPLDTSSQASVPETEASIESNPIHNSPTAVAYSSCSDSPTMDLSELQADAHLAINHMLSIKKSSNLERQQAIQDFKASLHQREAEGAATNERAKIVHSRKDLQARVKCTKAIINAKYDYRVAVQEASVVRCSELKEVEATYLEALCENVAAKSFHCTTLHREHAKYMSDLETQALEAENRSQQDFLSTHLAILCHAPPCPQRRSTFLLQYLIRELIIITSICSIYQGTPGTGVTTCNYFCEVRTHMVSPVKKASFLDRCTGRHVHRQELPHNFAGRTIKP